MTRRAMWAGWVMGLVAPVVLAGGPAEAQTAAPAPARGYVDAAAGLSIDELVALAMEHSPRLAASRARVEVARGEAVQAGLRSNLSAAIDQGVQVGGPDRAFALSVAWPLDLFRLDARRDAADRAAEAVVLRTREDEWRLAARVRQQAGRLLAAALAVDLTERLAAAARQARDLAASRVEAGAAAPLERDLAEVEARRLEAAAMRQRGEADAALAMLRAVVGLDAAAPLVLRDSLEVQVARTMRGAATAPAPAGPAGTPGRPDVRRLDAEVGAAEAERVRIGQEARVNVDLMGGYRRTHMSFPQFGFTAGGDPAAIAGVFDEVAVGATITLPLWNRNQGASAAAEAAARALARERDAAGLEAAAEVAAARARSAAARRTLEVYTGGLLDLARRNVDVLQETYQLGRGSLSDVVNERRRLLDIEMAYAGALVDVYDAEAALAEALGVIR